MCHTARWCFTIPKRLRVFFRYDRRLLGELAGCAWRALKVYFAAYFDGADVSPGAAGFLQTSGELLNQSKGKKIMHDKLLMAEGPEGQRKVIIGSAGFSRNVMSNLNFENMVSIDSDALFEYFMAHHLSTMIGNPKIRTTEVTEDFS